MMLVVSTNESLLVRRKKDSGSRNNAKRWPLFDVICHIANMGPEQT